MLVRRSYREEGGVTDRREGLQTGRRSYRRKEELQTGRRSYREEGVDVLNT